MKPVKLKVAGAGKSKKKLKLVTTCFRRGALCPHCKTGKLDYNGLLELARDKCGFALGGGAGCT
jgi:uncharacterized protein (DUF983 family)